MQIMAQKTVINFAVSVLCTVQFIRRWLIREEMSSKRSQYSQDKGVLCA